MRELKESGRGDVHKRHKRGGLSGKSLNNYAEALRAFCAWYVERGYLEKDPLDGLASFDATPKTQRRAMPPDDIARLLDVDPEQRRLLYEAAFCNGRRAGEFRALAVTLPACPHAARHRHPLSPARVNRSWTQDLDPVITIGKQGCTQLKAQFFLSLASIRDSRQH